MSFGMYSPLSIPVRLKYKMFFSLVPQQYILQVCRFVTKLYLIASGVLAHRATITERLVQGKFSLLLS